MKKPSSYTTPKSGTLAAAGLLTAAILFGNLALGSLSRAHPGFAGWPLASGAARQANTSHNSQVVHHKAPPAEPHSAGIPIHFTDVRQAAGIAFQHDATMTEEKNYLETMGNGLGWIDFDQDGLMDLYLVQTAATEWYKPPRPLRSALYRNNGDGTFTDVTEKAGVGGRRVLRTGRGRGRF